MSPQDETFDEVQLYVYDVIHKFRRKYRLNFHECLSTAGLAYAQAYQSYDLSKGTKFPSWVVTNVQYALQDHVRELANAKQPVELNLDEHIKENPERFSVDEFVLGLSDDAKTLTMLVIDMPKDVRRIIRDLGEDVTDAADWVIRQSINRFLKRLGWSKRRVADAYREIKGAL